MKTGRDGKVMKHMVDWTGGDATVSVKFLNGAGQYSVANSLRLLHKKRADVFPHCTRVPCNHFLFHDGTGRDGK